MSDQSLKAVASAPEQPARPLDGARRPFDLEHPPAVVGADTLAEIYGVSRSQIYRRIRRGEFDSIRTTQPIGPKQFSGVLLARFLKGEPLYEPSFGRQRRA